MSREHNLVVDLARAGQSFKQIKETLETVYPDTALKKTAIYDILKKLKREEMLRTSTSSMARKLCGLTTSSPLWLPPWRMIAG